VTNSVLKAYTLSKGKGACKPAGCPTKRAPDVWDSAAFSSIFLASSFSYIPNIVHARPHAGNANRWATPRKTEIILWK